MNILLLSTHDIAGGAARSAYRLHQGFQSINVNSQMLVQEKSSSDKNVLAPKKRLAQTIAKTRLALDPLALNIYRHRDKSGFFLQCLPEGIANKVTQINPDIINLHWICEGFVQVETLTKLKRPLIWTLHDMWAFTGGCHYSRDCERFTQSCGSCPQLSSSSDKDLSHWVWQRKAKAWKNLNLTIVSPSSWLAQCARSSSLFKDLRIEVIPYGIDTQKYRPVPRHVARELLNLPQDKQLIFFGSAQASSDKRKGFHLLQAALEQLSQTNWQQKIELVVFGAPPNNNSHQFGFKTHYLGSFHDDLALQIVYSAADLFVLPSIQDNLPNTVLEAMSCGTPCVAFNIGGIPDMIQHQVNGYLAQPYQVEDFAQGIVWTLENIHRYDNLATSARETIIENFTLEKQAYRYLKLGDEIINSKSSTTSTKDLDCLSFSA